MVNPTKSNRYIVRFDSSMNRSGNSTRSDSWMVRSGRIIRRSDPTIQRLDLVGSTIFDYLTIRSDHSTIGSGRIFHICPSDGQIRPSKPNPTIPQSNLVEFAKSFHWVVSFDIQWSDPPYSTIGRLNLTIQRSDMVGSAISVHRMVGSDHPTIEFDRFLPFVVKMEGADYIGIAIVHDGSLVRMKNGTWEYASYKIGEVYE
ncbi:hypothetical protein FNV43_RR24743 [Rhamnella rubrinervis]|uniref:Uncharacterized protein n=1 Tax=Rhamnella rubrinervis TaxID=2594499 RepID=A0A8K0DMB9_9ROSA|nr:hypothetical protein FNV43_RR24743 [Rhamnella rubrinervis]